MLNNSKKKTRVFLWVCLHPNYRYLLLKITETNILLALKNKKDKRFEFLYGFGLDAPEY